MAEPAQAVPPSPGTPGTTQPEATPAPAAGVPSANADATKPAAGPPTAAQAPASGGAAKPAALAADKTGGGAAQPAHGGEEHAEEGAEEGPSKAEQAKKKAAEAAAKAKQHAAKLGAVLKKVSGGVSETIGAILWIPLLILKGDLSTRMIVIGLAVSATVLTMTSKQLMKRFTPKIQTHHKIDASYGDMARFFRNQQDLTNASESMVFLEKFSANITSHLGDIALVEFEFFVQCDSRETARKVTNHMSEVREAVAISIQGQEFGDLITEAGKDKFKARIASAINHIFQKWHDPGKVKNVFLTKFIMG